MSAQPEFRFGDSQPAPAPTGFFTAPGVYTDARSGRSFDFRPYELAKMRVELKVNGEDRGGSFFLVAYPVGMPINEIVMRPWVASMS